MDEVRELTRLGNLDALKADRQDHYADALVTLGDQLLRRPPRKYVDALVGVLPTKLLRHPPDWIRLYVLTSIGTEYGAVRGVEEALARYYEETGKLAFVEPLRRRKGLSLKNQFPYAARVLAQRGAVIYANE